jgi:hypothetical protein
MIRALHARPLGITALIIFFLVGTLISFLAGLSLLVPFACFNVMWRVNPHGHEVLLRIGLWAVVLLFAASASCAAAAAGLWRRTRWGHILAITLIGINLLSDLINAVLGIEPRALVGVPIALMILLYLVSRRVRDYFAQRPSIG